MLRLMFRASCFAFLLIFSLPSCPGAITVEFTFTDTFELPSPTAAAAER